MSKLTLTQRAVGALARKAGLVSPALGLKMLSLNSIFGGILSDRDFELVDFEQMLAFGTGKSWASFKACDAVGQTVKETPWVITKDRKKREPANLAALQRLLDRPNEFESFGTLLYKVTVSFKLTGNSFLLKDRTNMKGEQPEAIYFLNSARITIKTLRGRVVAYTYTWNGASIDIPPAEMIHIKRPHPNNDVWGIGDIEGGWDMFTDFSQRAASNNSFWKRGGLPAGVMVLDDSKPDYKLDYETFKKFKADFQAEYGGKPENGGKMAFLSGPWKFEKIGLDPDKVSSIEQSQWSTEQILALHGVPGSIIGLKISGRSGAGVQSSEKIDEINYRKHTVRPHCGWIEEALTLGLVQGYDPRAFFAFNVTGLIDLEQLTKDVSGLFDRGVLTPNEIRQMAFLEPDEDPAMDEHYLSAAYTPVELAGMANQQQTEAAANAAVQKHIANTIQ